MQRRFIAPASLVLVTALAIPDLARADAPASTPAPTAAPAPTPAPAPAPAESPSKREPSPGDFTTARNALREGLQLREKGDLQEALARLDSAYDLVPTPVTAFELGKTHLMLGHVLQAHELFKKVIRMPPSMEESTRSETARDEAARLAKEIEPRIPSIRIKLVIPPEATAVVRIDDEQIQTTGAETLRAVDPGPHDVFAKAGDGPEQKVHIDVAESETKEVALSPQWVKPKEPPPPPSREMFVRSTNPLVYIGFGTGLTTAIIASVAGVVAVNKHREARDQCGEHFCPPNATEGVGLNIDQASNAAAVYGLVSGVAGIFTIIFVGVGIYGIRKPIKERIVSVSPPPPPSPATIRPTVGFTSVGLTGTF